MSERNRPLQGGRLENMEKERREGGTINVKINSPIRHARGKGEVGRGEVRAYQSGCRRGRSQRTIRQKGPRVKGQILRRKASGRGTRVGGRRMPACKLKKQKKGIDTKPG